MDDDLQKETKTTTYPGPFHKDDFLVNPGRNLANLDEMVKGGRKKFTQETFSIYLQMISGR
ncbi:hypothetical protein [Halobacillus karajensis]|uniref:hypothetical protein n=1 Tax=Halobacillus karajensis TaxID=195088 RepID=UPI00055295E6|nr:hypothetical protein [Halobacillus karajensis]